MSEIMKPGTDIAVWSLVSRDTEVWGVSTSVTLLIEVEIWIIEFVELCSARQDSPPHTAPGVSESRNLFSEKFFPLSLCRRTRIVNVTREG